MPLKEVRTLPYLLQRIAHALHSWHADFRQLGLSALAVRTLAVLSLNKQASVGELAEATFLDQPTLSHILRRLSRAGLVEKARSSVDARTVLVTLTDEGRRVARRALQTARSHDRELTEGMTDEQGAALRMALETLHENILRRAERPTGAVKSPAARRSPRRTP
jgi:DNA-binding MarR family transcriptional regulator